MSRHLRNQCIFSFKQAHHTRSPEEPEVARVAEDAEDAEDDEGDEAAEAAVAENVQRELTLSEQCAQAKDDKKRAQQVLKDKARNEKHLDKKRQRVLNSVRKLSDEDIELAKLERAHPKPKAKPKAKGKAKAKAKAKAMA